MDNDEEEEEEETVLGLTDEECKVLRDMERRCKLNGSFHGFCRQDN